MNRLKITVTWLLAILLSATACTAGKSANNAVEVLAAPNTAEAVGKLFVEAVRSNDAELLDNSFVDVALARKMSPSETKEMSDRLIQLQMINGLTARFKDNLGKLRAQAELSGIPPEGIKFYSVKEYPSTDPELVPRVLGIELGSREVRGEVPVTYLFYDGRIYLFEILNTTTVFK